MAGGDRDRLMQAVLDGVATGDERAELERLLAADAGAQAEFERLRGLFEALARMPKAGPSAGFADRVIAALQHTTDGSAQSRQPFSTSGVIGPSGSDIIVRHSAGPATATREASGSNWGSQHMSTSRRGLWITGGVAAAVAALFFGGIIELPTSGENVTGTLAPAQRYRAPQPGESPVGAAIAPQGGPSTVGAGTGGAAAGNAANNAAANAANNAAANAANNAAANAANNAAANAANNAAANAANNAAANAANNAANNAAANAANNAAANAANNAAASGARNAANNAAANAANNAAANAANNAAANAANNAAANAANNAAANAANNAAASGARNAANNAAANAANNAAANAANNAAANAANNAAASGARNAANNASR